MTSDEKNTGSASNDSFLPPPPAGRSVQPPPLEETLGEDQSNRFFGGDYHPWRRFLARYVDIVLLSFGYNGFLLVLWSVLPEELGRIIDEITDMPVLGVLIPVAMIIPIESILLASFTSTPGKWIFGIRVVDAQGNPLSITAALQRSFIMVFAGMGLGLPCIALFTQLFAYYRLAKTGSTYWDRSAGAVVKHSPWTLLRILIAVTSFLVVFGLLFGINYLEARDMI